MLSCYTMTVMLSAYHSRWLFADTIHFTFLLQNMESLRISKHLGHYVDISNEQISQRPLQWMFLWIYEMFDWLTT